MNRNTLRCFLVTTISIMLSASGAQAQLTIMEENDPDCPGCVGIGITSPSGDGLHINRTTGGAADLLHLTNDGGLYITLANTAANKIWYLNHEDADPNRFIISSIKKAGPQLAMTTNGDMEISGSLTSVGSGNVVSYFESDDNGEVQLRLKTDSNIRRLIGTNSSDYVQSQVILGDDGSFDFLGHDENEARMSIASNGDVTIEGTLVTGGEGTCDPGPCDATFTDYQLESIEEHAAYMWENHHLWGVGPTPEGAPINLSQKTTGILHELEKAHIYIEQLNDALKSQQSLIEQQQKALEQLTHRIAELGKE